MSDKDPYKMIASLSIDLDSRYAVMRKRVDQEMYDALKNQEQMAKNLMGTSTRAAFDFESIQHSLNAGKREELRRHNELVSVGKEQVETLEALLRDSQNAIEQRNALIRFLVQVMVDMEASNGEKKRTLTELLTRLSSIAAFGNDLSDLGKMITGAIDELAKEN
ncbi:hypothetical protein ASF99_04855 [Exiguobacterium sp. Leaf187]|uniref:hypothetical protein n=1 Tax=Exiguobacterium sp. Leaf187 TaxID=1736294 RepID=UPI0006F2ED78|nr:hypothetical protein [Exiguobacterium sp. Leaf187]KQS19218.1 hypothetical protein ASF99_04855 [Exiguobacterium sp. Leaf187]